jgi:2-desacetyl-2-hydroxyethyl bacteriochlorophyllide A dehydrogenase
MKTRAVVFPEADRFEVRELTLDAAGPDDIVVKTLITAISPGTERWVLRGKHIGSEFPCVPGYHRIGTVEEIGSEVSKYEPGDLVYGSAGRWQEEVVSMWGAHVGRSVGPAAGYHAVPDLSPEDMGELEPLAFTILAGVANRGMNFCEVRAGQKVLIIGAGFLGICAAQLAAHRGARPVLLEKNPDRISFLKGAMPELTCLSAEEGDLARKLEEIAPDGFDILHDTVGHAPTTDAMVQHVRPQGTLLLQAQYFDREACAVDLDQIKIKELTVKTTCGTREDDWEQTTAHIRAGNLKIAPMITHRFEAEDVLEGYELLHTGEPHNLGIVFHWDELAASS